jgi:chaperonin GroEL
MALHYYPRPKRRVFFGLPARQAFLRGVDKMARLVRPTLGPLPRNVAIQPLVGSDKSPELLDDGGTILRRVIELPDRYESMGAMLIRQLAWKVKDEVGDGTATAVVIAQSVMHESTRYIEAGGNPMIIRRGIERGLQVALAHLDTLKTPIETQTEITQVAIAATGDEEMGRFLGEMFDIVGPDGTITVEESPRAFLDRRYIEGVTWDKGYVSPYMVTDQDRMEGVLDSPAVLITDRWIKDAAQMVPLMQRLHAAGEKNLFIVANDIEGDALALLVTNKLHDRLITIGVKAPGYGDRRGKILEDLAILTGGRVISEDAGDMLEEVQLEHLGRAQRVWVNKDYFSIIGGAGDPQRLRERIGEVKEDITYYKKSKDEYEEGKARERLGKLVGGVAILTVGAATESDVKLLKARAEDAVRTLRAAIEEGVVPGGGAALLWCAEQVRALEATGDEAVGLQILARALEEPMRRIVLNAGLEDAPVIARVREKGPGWGFDVRSGEVVEMVAAGIYDPARVVRVAVDTGVSGALMGVTTEALVLRKHSQYDIATNP